MVVAHAKDPHQPARPTATTASEATATACVLLPGVDRQQLAQKAEALEAAAAAAHKAAQQLNKEGRYEVCVTHVAYSCVKCFSPVEAADAKSQPLNVRS